MTGRVLLATIVAIALAAPVFAGDIVAMPTGNMVAPGDLELNAIYWNMAPGGSTNDLEVGEAFVGVMKRVELDVLHARQRDADNYTEVNGYLRLIDETASHPSLIVGATNLLEADWLQGSDQASFFAVSSFNLAAPEAITAQTPLVRLHVGYGNEFHGDKLFGGLQFMVTPKVGGAVFNYQGNMQYMVTVKPCKRVEATAGVIDGDAFYRLGINTAL
jgi:hypothetical protein